MSQKLFESDFQTVDLRTLFNNTNEATTDTKGAMTGDADLSDWLNANWEADVAKQLLALGEPLRKAIKVLGFDPTVNPILGFIKKDFTKKLLKDKKLNTLTFKAIYNAVAKKYVADSEFIRDMLPQEYNIIYCEDLYNKSAAEMEEYLKLQSTNLKVSDSTYDADKQSRNKKIFLSMSVLNADNKEELDIVKRAVIINKPETKAVDTTIGATLNSLKLAKEIAGKTKIDKVELAKDTQDKIVNQVKGDIAKIFAVLMSLSLSTGNEEARKALSNGMFSGLQAGKIAEATKWLATNNVLVKGQIQDSDADSLVKKLLALIVARQQ